jgi:hypothetical protein
MPKPKAVRGRKTLSSPSQFPSTKGSISKDSGQDGQKCPPPLGQKCPPGQKCPTHQNWSTPEDSKQGKIFGDESIKSTVWTKKPDKEVSKALNLMFLAGTITSIVNTVGMFLAGEKCQMTAPEAKAITEANKQYLETVEIEAMTPEMMLLIAYLPYGFKVASNASLDKLIPKRQVDPVLKVFKNKAEDENGPQTNSRNDG